MIGSLIYAITGLVEFLVGMRVLLRLLGANPDNGFVNWIYSWSHPLVTPFSGIFGQDATITSIGTVTHSVFDWTALIALIVYGLVGAIVGGVALRARQHIGARH